MLVLVFFDVLCIVYIVNIDVCNIYIKKNYKVRCKILILGWVFNKYYLI